MQTIPNISIGRSKLVLLSVLMLNSILLQGCGEKVNEVWHSMLGSHDVSLYMVRGTAIQTLVVGFRIDGKAGYFPLLVEQRGLGANTIVQVFADDETKYLLFRSHGAQQQSELILSPSQNALFNSGIKYQPASTHPRVEWGDIKGQFAEGEVERLPIHWSPVATVTVRSE